MTTLVAPRAVAPAPVQPRPPNQTALQITGRPYVSYSQLSLMRACPKKFFMSYVQQAPRDFVASSLIYGGAIHSSLESYFRGRLEGVTLSAADLLHVYQSSWRQQVESAGPGVPVQFNKTEDEAKVHALAQRTIDAFLASPLAEPKGVVLGVEEELRITLHPDLPDVLARVDLVTMTDTAVFVTDFKTARSRWTEQKALESGDQLLLYGVTAAGMARHLCLPIKLFFAVLTKNKTPQVQILPVPTDASRVAAMKDMALTTWRAIHDGNFYPNPSPMNCSTCPFKSRCPAMGGRSSA
jgi:putative RecB family exonuclease